MGLLDKIRKKKAIDPDDRRQTLLTTGRITDGVIIDLDEDPSGNEIVFYVYTLNGVDFESSDVLTPEQARQPIRYAPGAKVGVRYDPRNQGNSIIE